MIEHVATLVDRLGRYARLPAWLSPSRASESVAVSGEVTMKVHDVEQIRRRIPEWDELDKSEKYRRLQEYGPPPVRVETTSNTVVDGLLTYVVDHIDPNQSPTALDASHLAVGTGSTTPSTGDSSLATEVYREAVQGSNDAGKDMETTTFLDETEANGNEIKEVGLFTASSGGTMLNRSLVSAEVKTNQKTITYENVLQWRAA